MICNFSNWTSKTPTNHENGTIKIKLPKTRLKSNRPKMMMFVTITMIPDKINITLNVIGKTFERLIAAAVQSALPKLIATVKALPKLFKKIEK